MNGSETLTAPAQADTDVAYVYERADGTIERANNAAEAFNLCPVLREMAQENPEQANVLLELAAVGREKMEKENKEEKKEPEIEERLEDKQKKTTVIKEPLSPAKLEQPVRPEKPKQVIETAQSEPQVTVKTSEITATHFVEQAIQQKPLEIAGIEPARTEQSKQPETSQSSQIISKAEETEQAPQTQLASGDKDKAEVRDVPKPANINQQSELNNALPQPQVAGTAEQVEVKSSAQSEILDASKNQEDYFEMPTVVTDALTDTDDAEIEVALNEVENFSGDYEISVLEASYQIPDIENEEAATFEAETYTDEQLEALFEPETVETYKELMALIENDETERLAIVEPNEAQTDVGFELIETNPEEHSVNEFETFIAEQPAIEVPITLETIQEQANEQLLEQTLAQLVELLSNDDTDGIQEPANLLAETEEVAEQIEQKDELFELRRLLQEIAAELPSCYIVNEEQETKIRITPELTEKLLALLRHLGYEHPNEALVGLVKQYGLAFLLQALQYMCQLNSEYERREFVTAPASISSDDDEDTRLRIGKAIFGLISGLNLEPASSIS